MADVNELVGRVGGLKAHNAREDDAGRRREARLRAQRGGRRDIVALARGLVGVPMEEDDEADRSGDEGGCGRVGEPRPRVVAMHEGGVQGETTGVDLRSAKATHANALMLPEWMAEVPEDLARSWMVLPRPAGQRCLVVSARGQTTARRRNGAVLAHFPSALPGGRRASAREQRGAGGARAFCVLDCIFDPSAKVYHVVDVMVWRGYLLYDCHAAFRLFWAHAKLGEVDATVASRTNPCAFLPLPYYAVSRESLAQLYAAEWPYARDGLLFVHRETVYEPGATPLVLLWTDAKCSARFFNYDSDAARARAPAGGQADAWRHEAREAAITYDELLAAVAASEASLDDTMAADAALASLSRGAPAPHPSGRRPDAAPANGGCRRAHDRRSLA
ncbi:hypothetical protein KFE25_000938 [Diacronema lutheri]|uniref:Snurportin-1 n=1 Tax=Diacronema lutheri TaxID=2081491 RepID=A0A8J5XAB0_DIALT|nr:hypothetical protein KFE25_000938 [Diacronema lutheri]